MKTEKIRRISLLEIQDEKTRQVYYGCDQEWYPTKWQRVSGCGPTAVSNIVCYLKQRRLPEKAEKPRLTRARCRRLMEDVWKYVTPTADGIPTAEILCKGIRAYADAKKLPVKLSVLNIPEPRGKRPAFSSVLAFLADALRDDIPVAFLNLDQGEEKSLDSWHWVTAVSLEYEDRGAAELEILDEGKVKRVDLSLWYRTSSLGGGFVRVNPAPQ